MSTTAAPQGARAEACKKCGRTDHRRSNSRKCPFHKQNVQGPGGAEAERDAQGVPRPSTATFVTKSLRWERCAEPDEYELTFQGDAIDKLFVPRLKKQCKDIVSQVLDRCKAEFSLLRDDMSKLSPFHVFMVLARRFLETMMSWTNQRLREEMVGIEKAEMGFGEMLGFVGTYMLHQLYNVASEDLLADVKKIIGDASARIPGLERYHAIIKCTKATDPATEAATGERFGRTVDTIANVRMFERVLFESTRRLTLSHSLQFVVDDELVGSRSKEVQKRAVSHRKAGKDGTKNDAVADSLLRIMYAVRHQERLNYNQDNAVDELLEDMDTIDGVGGRIHGSLGTGDNGYSKDRFWSALTDKEVKFITIVKKAWHPFVPLSELAKKVVAAEKRSKVSPGPLIDTVANVIARAQKVNVPVEAGFVVGDDPHLGRELFSARATVSVGDATKVVHAFAFRDYQARDAAKGGNIVRFFESGTDISDEIKRTVCFDEKTIPENIKPAKVALFFPCERKSAELRMVESKLRDQGVLPITCWQRSADWFVARLFCVTGTASGLLAGKDPRARALLVRGPAVTCQTQDHEDSALLGEVSSDQNGTSPTPQAVGNCDADGSGSQGDDGDGDSTAESDTESVDEGSVVFSESGAEGVMARSGMGDSASAAAPAGSLTQTSGANNAELLEMGAEILARSWLFARGLSTQMMKSGTINEDNLFKVLQRSAWCHEIFHVGLLARESHPYLAVSSDAVAMVVPPSAGPEVEAALASVEFKTRSAPSPLSRARSVAQQRGSYFACTVGDDCWWDAVPSEHRGQVLHQAMVLDVELVVYVEGSTTELIYACLVTVPSSARETFKAALVRFEPLVLWAHASVGHGDQADAAANSDGSPSTTATQPPPKPPSIFGEAVCERLTSHMRLWRALLKRIRRTGPLHPVHVFKSYSQAAYNALKGGLDGHTQFVAALTNPTTLKFGLKQLLAFRGIRQLASNAFILYRIIKACTNEDDVFRFPFARLSSFRNKCNKVIAVTKFARALALSLIEHSNTAGSIEALTTGVLPAVPGVPVQDFLSEADAAKVRKSSKRSISSLQKQFDAGDAKRLRLSSHFKHNPVPVGQRQSTSAGGAVATVARQSTCVVCEGQSAYKCDTCGVALHISRVKKRTVTCFVDFHTRSNLRSHHK